MEFIKEEPDGSYTITNCCAVAGLGGKGNRDGSFAYYIGCLLYTSKSLVFQLPAIYLGNEYKLLTRVVSPLKALIVDQVEALQELGYERVDMCIRDRFLAIRD